MLYFNSYFNLFKVKTQPSFQTFRGSTFIRYSNSKSDLISRLFSYKNKRKSVSQSIAYDIGNG